MVRGVMWMFISQYTIRDCHWSVSGHVTSGRRVVGHLEVALVPVDDELLPGVDDLHVGEVALVLLLHRLVHPPVVQLSTNLYELTQGLEKVPTMAFFSLKA